MGVNNRVTLALICFVSVVLPAVSQQVSNHSMQLSYPVTSEDDSGNTVKIDYRNSGPEVRHSSDPSRKYVRLFIPGHHFTSETGMPEMPVYSTMIKVPQDMSVGITISDVKYESIRFADQNFKHKQVYPSQPARTKNEIPEEKVIVKDKRIYRTRGNLPHDTVIITRVGRYRGMDLVNISVYPCFYNPSAGSVDLITSMSLGINYTTCETKGTGNKLPAEAESNTKSTKYITGFTDRPVSMIIITDSIFHNALKPFIHWKMMTGIKTKTVYCINGSDDAKYSQLKDSITAIYSRGATEGNPPQYILIAGDVSIIPASAETTNVSDMYYGEVDGDEDYIPELFVGRLPAPDTTTLKNVLKKIIAYESYSFDESNIFWSGALVTAGNDQSYADYMNGQVNYIYNNYFNADATITATKWLYPTAPVKDDSLKILVNNGLGILNYTGHGASTGLADPSLKVTSIGSLTNTDKYPLIVANACRTAQISVTPCFGTEIINAADKGAIGYIGCTNDSYWSEDFYWAVGAGTPGLTATYSNTGLGAFDKLFHTHDEEPPEWAYTLGQMNFAGNMAVSASTSPRIKYYWETYILLGDPSMSVYIGKPDTFNISVPDTIPFELDNLGFFSTPFSYTALSDFDTLWDARFVNPSGSVTLSIPDLAKDSCLLIVTGQNMVPYKKTIYFSDITDEFLSYDSIIVDDSEGNNDHNPDYGERINLKFRINNLGNKEATNLSASLEVLSGMLAIEQGTAVIGTLPAKSSYTIDNEFIITISDEVPDEDIASLLLTLSDDKTDYSFGIELILHAPELRIISSVPDDINTGNANWLPDPGETIMLDVRIINEGSSTTSGTLSVNQGSTYFTLTSESIETGILDPGTEKTLSFEGTLSASAGSGTIIPYEAILTCGKYNAAKEFSLSTGKTRETWEHSLLTVFPWILHNTYPWMISSSYSYENLLSARSAVIPDGVESVLALTLNTPVPDTVSFYSKISSEAGYDFFIFRIDSVERIRASGEDDWRLRKTTIDPGIHYLEWVYKKDISLSGGLDAVWIDMITFPSISFLGYDLSVDTLMILPESEAGNSYSISANIINLGRTSLTSFPMAYRINSGEIINETFYQKIDPGDTIEVAFTAKPDLFSEISYNVNVFTTLPEDGYHLNDTAKVLFLKTGDIPEVPSDSIHIFPNPFHDKINLYHSFEISGNLRIEIYDIAGRMVMVRNEEIISGEEIIPLSLAGFVPGVYTLRVIADNRNYSVRIIKEY